MANASTITMSVWSFSLTFFSTLPKDVQPARLRRSCFVCKFSCLFLVNCSCYSHFNSRHRFLSNIFSMHVNSLNEQLLYTQTKSQKEINRQTNTHTNVYKLKYGTITASKIAKNNKVWCTYLASYVFVWKHCRCVCCAALDEKFYWPWQIINIHSMSLSLALLPSLLSRIHVTLTIVSHLSNLVASHQMNVETYAVSCIFVYSYSFLYLHWISHKAFLCVFVLMQLVSIPPNFANVRKSQANNCFSSLE